MSEIQKSSEQLFLKDINFSDIPDEVGAYLASQLKSWGESAAGQIQQTNYEGVSTYLMPVIDTTGKSSDDSVFLVDVDEEGKRIGTGLFASSALNGKPPYDKPFVGFTRTESGHTRKGLGMRRIKLMNQLALKRHGQVLYSDPGDDITYEAKKVWEKLVESGEAERVQDENYSRFRFKPLHR